MFQILVKNEEGAVLWDSALPFRLDFGATGLKEVLQNVAVLFMTPILSQGLDRELGLDMSFVDRPIPISRNMLVSEIAVKLPMFEDRAEVVSVEFPPADSAAGHVAAAFVMRFHV
jgi:hypothetical protein